MTLREFKNKLKNHQYKLFHRLHLIKIFKNNKNIYVLINNQVMYYELSK